jgi:signal transduction histidine kinase
LGEAAQRRDFGAMFNDISRIVSTVDHLVKTVKALRALVSKNCEYHSTPIESLLEDVVAVAKLRADQMRIQVKIEVQSGLSVRIMREVLLQAVLNLVANAMDALEGLRTEGSWVAVRACADERWLVLEVTDNGPGIDSNVLPLLKEGFAFTSHPDQGLGMGLELVRQAAEKHAGTFDIDSPITAGGTGTRAVLKIPRAVQAG